MRYFCNVFFLLFLLINYSCKKLETQTILIQGNVHINDRPSTLSLVKHDIINDEIENYLINIDSTGHFEYSLTLNYPQSIFLGLTSSHNMSFFAYPKDTISIQFNDSVSVEYLNLKHQEFNSNFNLIENEILKIQQEFLNPMTYKKLSEKELKLCLDSIKINFKRKLDLFKRQNKLDDKFIQVVKNEIDFFIISSVVDYEFFNKNIFLQKRNVTNEFYWLLDTLTLNYNEILLTQHTINFFNRIQLKYPNPITTNSFNEILKINPSLLRDILLCKTIYSDISSKNFNEVNLWMENYFPEVQNQTLRNDLTLKYKNSLEIYKNPHLSSAKLIALNKGDKTGILKEITSTYPNKVLYLKFWAPYCGPCIAQLPYMKQIENKFNPNDFLTINICAPYPKEKWKATIKEKNIGGVHYLLNDNQFNELKSLFNIQGIPRYVLIDRKGNIAVEDAPIPGDEMLQGINFDLVNKINELIK